MELMGSRVSDVAAVFDDSSRFVQEREKFKEFTRTDPGPERGQIFI